MNNTQRSIVALALCGVAPIAFAAAQDTRQAAPLTSVPRLTTLANSSSELTNTVDRYSLDRTALTRRYDATDSPAQRKRMREFYDGLAHAAPRARLRQLSQEGRVDYVLLDNYLQHQIALLDRRDKQRAEAAPLLPFADRLLALQDARRDLETVDHAAVARTLADVAQAGRQLCARCFEPPPARRAWAAAHDGRRQRPRQARATARVPHRRQSRRRGPRRACAAC